MVYLLMLTSIVALGIFCPFHLLTFPYYRIIRAFLVEEQKIVKKVLKIQKTKEKTTSKWGSQSSLHPWGLFGGRWWWMFSKKISICMLGWWFLNLNLARDCDQFSMLSSWKSRHLPCSLWLATLNYISTDFLCLGIICVMLLLKGNVHASWCGFLFLRELLWFSGWSIRETSCEHRDVWI